MMIHAGLNLKSIALFLIISTAGYFAGTAILGSGEQQSTPDETSTDLTGLLTIEQLVELVGPIALYPDELLAIVIPASTYPMEIVQASRFLEQYKNQPDLKPDEQWEPSVLGLLNYPEVVELMNNDLDWTWKLGEAVVNQQDDVMEAIQQFRNKAQEAGNLESNDKQIIVVEKEIIKIESASPEVIYVPSYRPSTVVVYQTTPYPYYYSSPYPYYYNPAATFWTGVFVGAAITYGIHWGSHGRWYGRGRTDINVYRGGNNINIGSGNTWKPGGGNRPGNRPGLGNRPGSGNRPGAGIRPGTGTRPGAGTKPGIGSRPSTGTRPGSGTRPSTGKKPSNGQRPSSQPSNQRRSTATIQQSKRTRSSSGGSFGGYKSGQTTSRNSQRGQKSRTSQSNYRTSRRSSGSSARRSGGGSRGGGGGGGGRRR